MAKKRKKSKVKKRIIQALVLSVLIGGLVWFFLPRAVMVDTDEARIGSLSSTIEATGKTRARDRYVVWAPVAGTVQRLSISVGDPVVLDQVIVRLVPDALALSDPQTSKLLNDRISAAEAAKSRALAERDQVTANLEQVRSDLRATEQLAAAGQANAIQREQAQIAVKLAFKDLEAASHAVQSASSDMAAAQMALGQIRQGAVREWVMRAPVSGTVLMVKDGGNVAAGESLMEIGNPKDLEVVMEASATDAAQIKPGQRVVLKPMGADAQEGRVRRVEMETPAEEGAPPKRAQVTIEFADTPSKWQFLGDGRSVETRITTATVDNIVKVPVSAVFADGQQSAVYVVENGKARKRTVVAGMHNADDVVIEKGLQESDVVILSPNAKIKDGARVKTR